MPELPEVEVLVRHLQPLLRHQTIRAVAIHRQRVIRPTATSAFRRALMGAKILGLSRRGKYLLFRLQPARSRRTFTLVGHLGMTGRMFVAPRTAPLPKHTAVVLELGQRRFIYEDQRFFGRLTLDHSAVDRLGPEPLGREFSAQAFAGSLQRSTQPIKIKLLDQSVVAGVGNIYASEALFRARIPPRLAARRLPGAQVRALWRAIRQVLTEAIRYGSTIPLSFAAGSDGLFYFGSDAGASDYYEERLRVYDRASQPCVNCGTRIRRIVQAARSTYFCPRCQSRVGAEGKRV